MTLVNGHAQLDDLAKLKMSEPAEKKSKSSTDLDLFDELFPVLVDDLTKTGIKDNEISDAMQWFKEVCEYNVPFGKKNRGLTVVHSCRYLLGDKVTDEDLKLARVLGWCIEWLQAFFLVADDIMDQSVTRRGKPCWYRQEKVGLVAINDAFFLESCLYTVLKKYFREKPCYVELMELFHEVTHQTITGQCLDLRTAPTNKIDFAPFTVERHAAIVKWKTAYYSFYLPVACAMYMVGIKDQESHSNARTILLKMGEFFQIQDDYLDCYGDPAVTGKVGTDIEDNKCSWLVVQALTRATPEQRKVLEENYAQHDPEKVAKVKAVFNELALKQLYVDYEDRSYEELMTLVQKLSGNLPKEMFMAYAQKIYKREK